MCNCTNITCHWPGYIPRATMTGLFSNLTAVVEPFIVTCQNRFIYRDLREAHFICPLKAYDTSNWIFSRSSQYINWPSERSRRNFVVSIRCPSESQVKPDSPDVTSDIICDAFMAGPWRWHEREEDTARLTLAKDAEAAEARAGPGVGVGSISKAALYSLSYVGRQSLETPAN